MKEKVFIRSGIAIISVFVALLIALGLSGCGGTSEKSSPKNEATEEQVKEVDFSNLEKSIATAQGFAAEAYTESTYSALAQSVEAGEALLKNDKATQSEVNKAANDITTAISGLKEAFNPDNYQWVAFSDVARSPDSYKGQLLAFSGKVLQVTEGTSENSIRLSTNGKYDDVVMVGYAPDLLDFRILDDDMITIYGTCVGLYSYTAVSGATISLPAVYADNIVLQ